MVALMALAAWNMKTVNDLQLEMREVMVESCYCKKTLKNYVQIFCDYSGYCTMML